MGIVSLAGIAASIAFALSMHLFTDAIPKLARIAVARAARRMPVALKQNQEAAWLADFAHLETHYEMLCCAVACWITSYRVLPPFQVEESVRELRKARVALRTYGAIASYALHRIKAWDTPADPVQWSICERWCVTAVVVCKEPIKQSMKEYLLALERDLKERPRDYKSREAAAQDLFLPIWREMKIYQFLHDHDLNTNFRK